MHNVRGVPALSGNMDKTDDFERFIRQNNPAIMTIMESGLHNKKKADMPPQFNKELANNIIS